MGANPKVSIGERALEGWLGSCPFLPEGAMPPEKTAGATFARLLKPPLPARKK